MADIIIHKLFDIVPEFRLKLIKILETYVTLMDIKWKELFGFVATKLVACSTPVVAYNRGTLKAIISHRKTGYLCNNFKELYNACLCTLEISRSRDK